MRPLWLPELCRFVLRLHGSLDVLIKRLAGCRLVIVDDRDCRHVLAERSAQAVQIRITELPLIGDRLLVDVPDRTATWRNEVRLVDELLGLTAPEFLRRPMRGRSCETRRSSIVLRALDGSLADASQQEIAFALFGPARTKREWRDAGGHLRDTIRRAVSRGRFLMKGGYLGLLR